MAGSLAALACVVGTGCNRHPFPEVPPGYREFAYVSNGGSNTVSVLDLVYLRQDRTLKVGDQPTGLSINPKRNEVYVVNSRSGSLSVIDTDSNSVVATIPVHKLPYFVDVDPQGKFAYVANSGSNSVSVIDLDARKEVGVVGTGEQPGVVKVAPDGRSIVAAIAAAEAYPSMTCSLPGCQSCVRVLRTVRGRPMSQFFLTRLQQKPLLPVQAATR